MRLRLGRKGRGRYRYWNTEWKVGNKSHGNKDLKEHMQKCAPDVLPIKKLNSRWGLFSIVLQLHRMINR